jgi:translation initiation factor 3 subunit I
MITHVEPCRVNLTFCSFATQRPVLLKGHERPVTHLQFNREGDLLFSASKSFAPTVWWGDSGERIGTFDGHGGAVWYLDVTRTC